MSRLRRKRLETGPFAMLPVDVLTSPAVRTLPHIAHRVLVALAAQFFGRNNGSLTLTRRTAKSYGIGSPLTLAASLGELEARGLIFRTRPGSRIPPRSAMYAIAWKGVDEALVHDAHDATPNPIARHTYGAWVPSKNSQKLGSPTTHDSRSLTIASHVQYPHTRRFREIDAFYKRR
jgi:hypothetical protein